MDAGVSGDTDAGTDGGIIRDTGPPPPVDAGRIGGSDGGPVLVLDAGDPTVDAGPPPPDAGPPPCTSAADCADGIACNGVERCVAGTCMPGTALTCDDGITCTNDTCVEPGNCNFAPDDTRCPAGQSCDARTGCVTGCAEMPCRLVAPQCGCPGGQGCYVDGTGRRLCATAGGGTEGGTCTSTTSCVAGNLCININASGTTNLCSRFCNADADCATNALCLITLNDGMGGSVPGVTLCTHACDPVRNTGCVAGSACDIFPERMGAMRTFTDCTAPVGAGAQGAPCAVSNQCQAGYACIDPDGAAGPMPQQCMHWCEVATGTGCAGTGATRCVGFMIPARVGTTEYGVCL